MGSFFRFVWSFISFWKKKKKLPPKHQEEIENLLAEEHFGGDHSLHVMKNIIGHTFDEKINYLEKNIKESLKKHEKYLMDHLWGNPNHFQPCIFLGVNGVGKTTIMAKILAKILEKYIAHKDQEKQEPLRLYVVAGDTFRAAAQEQLFHWTSTICQEKSLEFSLEKWDYSPHLSKKPLKTKPLVEFSGEKDLKKNQGQNPTEDHCDDLDKSNGEKSSFHNVDSTISIVFLCGAQDPGVLLYGALEAEKLALKNLLPQESKGKAFLLMDTSGRLPNNSNLMNQLLKLKTIVEKYKKLWSNDLGGNSNEEENNKELLKQSWILQEEIVLCCDASSGQHVVTQCDVFNKALGLTGLIFNKVDACRPLGLFSKLSTLYPELPFYGMGMGEKLKDIEHFDHKKLFFTTPKKLLP